LFYEGTSRLSNWKTVKNVCLEIWNGANIKIVALLGDKSDGLKLLLDFKSSSVFGKK
jgi:hypothetical protein